MCRRFVVCWFTRTVTLRIPDGRHDTPVMASMASKLTDHVGKYVLFARTCADSAMRDGSVSIPDRRVGSWCTTSVCRAMICAINASCAC